MNQVPIEAIISGPAVKRHTDGPVLEWAGHLHWLTWRERFRLLFRRTTVAQLAEQHWPHLARAYRMIVQ